MKIKRIIAGLLSVILVGQISSVCAEEVSETENQKSEAAVLTVASDFQLLYDFSHIYGDENELYAVYWKNIGVNKFDIIKKTYLGNCLEITCNEGAVKDKVLDIVNKYIDIKNTDVFELNISEDEPVVIRVEANATGNAIFTNENAVEIVSELNANELIAKAEFAYSRFNLRHCTAVTDKYPVKYLNSIKENFSDIDADEDSEYGEGFIKLSTGTDSCSVSDIYSKIHSKTGAVYDISWSDDAEIFEEKSDLEMMIKSSLFPPYKADSEESLEALEKILSKYSDLSDGGRIYVNPEYSVEFFKADNNAEEKYIMLITGISNKEAIEKRSDVFVTDLKVPVFSIWDKISKPVYSGEIAGGYIDGVYYSVITCVENELPVKNANEEYMTDEEIPEYMRKYIFPDSTAAETKTENTVAKSSPVFEDLLSMSDEDYKKYCEGNNFTYVNPEDYPPDYFLIFVDPLKYLKSDVKDRTGNEDYYTSDYDFEKFINELVYPDNYYYIKDENFSIVHLNNEKKLQCALRIKPEAFNSEYKNRLYQLTYSWPEILQYPIDIIEQRPGAKDTASNPTVAAAGDIDLNGTVELNDLTLLSLYLLGDVELTDSQISAADVTGDSITDIADLALLKQYIMGEKVKLGK